MNFADCIKLTNQNPTACVATVDEKGQPRVRAYADETGFYFQTGTVKEIYGQLKKNPTVEVCWFNNKREGCIMLWVAGALSS